MSMAENSFRTSSSWSVLLLFFVVLLLALVAKHLQRWRIRARYIVDNGCQSAPHYKHHRFSFLGLDYLADFSRASKQRRSLEKMSHDVELYGRTFQLSMLGGELVVTQDPENIHSVLLQDFGNWGVAGIRREAFKPLLGNSFFLNDGPIWRMGRNQTRPSLARTEYSDLSRFDVFVNRYLSLIPSNGSVIDMAPLTARLFQDLGTQFFFGAPVNALAGGPDEGEQADLLDALKVSISTARSRMLLGGLNKFLPVSRAFKNAVRVLHEFIDRNVDRCLLQASNKETSGETRIDFINDLAGNHLDRSFIRNSAMIMYMGATDTTGTALANVILCLARHPEVLSRLRQEILTLDSTSPEPSAMNKLPYLRAVIKETLRLYPPGSGTLRVALKDTILPTGGGPDRKAPIFVKEGTKCMIFFWGLHRDTSIWGSDAEKYKPERFLTSKIDAHMFLPFSLGGRMCPGQNLAMTNLSYLLIKILQNFKNIAAADNLPWEEDIKLVTGNKNGCRVIFEKA